MVLELFNDLTLIVFGDCILLSMAVLEAALLRFEWLQLRHSISSETGHGRRGQRVLAMLVMKRLLYMVPADERLVHAHKVDICNVIHEEEELCLSTWRLCNQLMHLLERRHLWSIVSKTELNVMANVFH